MDRIALITGANRGIGFETGKQLLQRGWTVIFTARNMHVGRPLVNDLRASHKSAWFHQLDVTDEQSVEDLAAWMGEQFDHLDVLVNNAGILMNQRQGVREISLEDMSETLDTNLIGPLLVTRALLGLLSKSNDARVINLSSRMGQLATMGSGYTAYRISKTALNALSVIMSQELAADGIRVNAMCPGWVRSEMGGPSAGRSLPEGADTVVWLATAAEIPSGKFIADREVITW